MHVQRAPGTGACPHPDPGPATASALSGKGGLPSTGEPAGLPAPTRMQDLSAEIWLACGDYLDLKSSAAFFFHQPALEGSLDIVERLRAMQKVVIDSSDVEVIAAQVALALRTGGCGVVVRDAIRRGCCMLWPPCTPQDARPVYRLLLACMEAAQQFPAVERTALLCQLTCLLPRLLGSLSCFEEALHGRFATKLMTGLLEAAGASSARAWCTIAQTQDVVCDLIDLESAALRANGAILQYLETRRRRARQFLAVLAAPPAQVLATAATWAETALRSSTQLLRGYLREEPDAFVPMLRDWIARLPGQELSDGLIDVLALLGSSRMAPALRRGLLEGVIDRVVGPQPPADGGTASPGTEALAPVLRQQRRRFDGLKRVTFDTLLRRHGYQGDAL